MGYGRDRACAARFLERRSGWGKRQVKYVTLCRMAWERRFMAAKVDLYNSSYGNYELDVYRRVRLETYGEDLGQTSWVTTEESNQIPKWLELKQDSEVLEIGCGSGRYALHVGELAGCRITGVDINAHGIRNANRLAQEAALSSVK